MEIVFLRQAHKFIRNAEEKLKLQIKNEVEIIRNSPLSAGKKLTGKLKGFLSRRFTYRGVQYRLVYVVKDKITVVALGSRENFYERL